MPWECKINPNAEAQIRRISAQQKLDERKTEEKDKKET
jgi:hypothetical protein